MAANASGSQYSREFRVTITGNNFGYRAGTWPRSNAAAKKNVALVGDSFAFGWGVDADHTVSAILNAEGYLNVYNLGMPGDGPLEQLARLRKMNSFVTAVDHVVLLFFDNDISDLQGEAAVPKNANTPTPGKWLSVRQASRSWLLRSHSVRLLSRGLESAGLSTVLASAFGYVHARHAIFGEILELHTERIVDHPKFRRAKSIYEDMFVKVHELGSKMVVVPICPEFISTPRLQDRNLAAIQRPRTDHDFAALDQALNDFFSYNGVKYTVFRPQNCEEA